MQRQFLKQYCEYSGPQLILTETRHGAYPFINYVACLFEVKVSRHDFLSTFGSEYGKQGNRHVPIAHLHWCVVPRGVVKAQELPAFWGLLESWGDGLRERRAPELQALPDDQWIIFMHRLLWYGGTRNRLGIGVGGSSL